ncbi:FAD-binding protein [Halomicroarcula sp. F13]|uniref:FAD-binding protein n=1 Tax=Haloarcula rubra TaxID=2487747 RepID=A0AAW4PLN8_9EURY|nr:FAD-binding protein [Halomicroarcula rubra]MBX0321540.1 FAD-binding protein [Halomicroarcula rubra]
MSDEPDSVVVVGGGVAGLSAAIYTARAGISTRIVSTGESILNRNAHLENYPGFPAGVNPRLLLELIRAQTRRAGAWFVDGRVQRVTETDDGFETTVENGETFESDYVIAASWADATYLDGLDVDVVDRGTKEFIGVDDCGRTAVDGLYAAGRLAEQHHQTIVAAGHGAQVGLTLVEDSDVDFYHDWTAPEGYFTDRDREVPPGCEEIGEEERKRREQESLEMMQRYFEEPMPGEPTMHPSVADEE